MGIIVSWVMEHSFLSKEGTVTHIGREIDWTETGFMLPAL